MGSRPLTPRQKEGFAPPQSGPQCWSVFRVGAFRLALGLALASASYAGAAGRYGIVFGANLADVSTSGEAERGCECFTTTLAGFNTLRPRILGRPIFGLTFERSLGRQLSLVADPMILGRGARYKNFSAVGPLSTKARLSLLYVELPLSLKRNLTKGRTQWYVLAGPSAGLRIRARLWSRMDGVADDIIMRPEYAEDEWEFENARPFDLGMGVGAGVLLPAGRRHIMLEARYVHGLLDIDEHPMVSTVNRGLLIRAGIVFPWGRR